MAIIFLRSSFAKPTLSMVCMTENKRSEATNKEVYDETMLQFSRSPFVGLMRPHNSGNKVITVTESTFSSFPYPY